MTVNVVAANEFINSPNLRIKINVVFLKCPFGAKLSSPTFSNNPRLYPVSELPGN